MIKLLIVDDEPLIQVGIKSMINWSDYNIEICGTAINGQQALSLIEKHSPQIVITDIKMPIMDGLTLAKICKERYGNLPLFIILTSHEEIPLLKEAIKYDAVDYLIKLELTTESLLESIQKALKILEENHQLILPSSISSLHSFYEKFYISLLHNLFESRLQFEKEASVLNLDFTSAQGYAVAQCSIMNMDLNNTPSSELINVYYSTLQMLQEILPKYLPCHVFSLDMKYFCIIFCFSKALLPNYKKKVTEVIKAVFTTVHNYFNVTIYASIGNIVLDPMSIGESYQDARQLHPYLTEDKQLLFYEEHDISPESFTNNTFNLSLFKEDIKCAFEEYDANTLHQTITAIIDLFKAHPTRYLQAIDAACNILYLSLSLLQDGEELLSKLFKDYPEGYRSIYKQDSLEQIIRWLEILRDGLCDALSSQQKNYKHRIITQVKKYIDEHLEEKLSLIDVASQFGITPNYLSLLFKKHSETGFSEYIAQKKIAFAKDLMESSNLKVYEIADKLGFESAFYFSKVFKKVEGCSPRDYKQYK